MSPPDLKRPGRRREGHPGGGGGQGRSQARPRGHQFVCFPAGTVANFTKVFIDSGKVCFFHFTI